MRILYTKGEIYFGISCLDSEPEKIVATQLRRDISQELDDYCEIVIDSSHNRRNAYVFQFNPFGTQRDALITDEQPPQDDGSDGGPGWDGVWISEARINSWGWTATVAIPLSTLNFMQTNEVVWGINFKRFIRRKNEQDLWSAWSRAFGANKISQAGELHGISEIGSGRLFIVTHYGLTGFNHLPPAATSAGLTPGTEALYSRESGVPKKCRAICMLESGPNSSMKSEELKSGPVNVPTVDRIRISQEFRCKELLCR